MTKMKRVLMMGALMMALTSVSVGAFAATESTTTTCPNVEYCPYDGECPTDNMCAAPGTGRGYYRRATTNTARAQRGCGQGRGCR